MFLRLFENRKVCISSKCYYPHIVILTYKRLGFSRRISVTAGERRFHIPSLAVYRLTTLTRILHRHKDEGEIHTSIWYYSELFWHKGPLISNIYESLAEVMYKVLIPANKRKCLWNWSRNLKFSTGFGTTWSDAQIRKVKGQHFTMQHILTEWEYKYIKSSEWFKRGHFTWNLPVSNQISDKVWHM